MRLAPTRRLALPRNCCGSVHKITTALDMASMRLNDWQCQSMTCQNLSEMSDLCRCCAQEVKLERAAALGMGTFISTRLRFRR